MALKQSGSLPSGPQDLVNLDFADRRYRPISGEGRSWTTSSVANTNVPSFNTSVSVPINTQDRYIYLGGRHADLYNLSNSGGFGMRWKGGGAFEQVTSSWGVQYHAINTRYVEFMVAPLAADASVRIFVDDLEEQLLPHVYPSFPLYLFSTIKIDLGPAPRKVAPVIRVMVNSSMLLSTTWVEDGGQIVAAPPNNQDRLFILGDSLSAGEVQNVGGELGSYVGYMAKLSGVWDIWNGGVRGSGPNTNASSFGNYQTRATNDIPSDARTVVIHSWFNDRREGRTPAQMAADITTTILNIRAKAPLARVLVVGSPDPTGGTNASEWNSIDSAIQSACQAQAVPYASALTGQVWSGAGATLAILGAWISANTLSWMLGSDNLHPTDAGHQLIAERMVDTLRAVRYLGAQAGYRIVAIPASRSFPQPGEPGTLYIKVEG